MRIILLSLLFIPCLKNSYAQCPATANEDDGIACTIDVYNSGTGMYDHIPNHVLCDDGEPTTTDECDCSSGCTHTPLVEANFNEIIKKVASDRAPNDEFGHGVSISGEYAIVGAYQEDHDENGLNTVTDAGAAYIFKKGVNDEWQQIRKIVASDRAATDYFGFHVWISGDLAIVGALRNDYDESGSNFLNAAGAAYIFQKDEGGADNWGEVKKLVASDRDADDDFGVNVCISGNYAIVGSRFEGTGGNDAGAAYIFNKDEGGLNNWGEVRKLIASDAQVGDEFGNAVSISGEYVLVGAYREDAGGSDAGAAYIFQKDEGGVDNWGEVGKLTASDAQADDFFGGRTSISGDYALVGAQNEDSGGSNAGAAYIFKRDQGGDNNWGQVKKMVASNAEAGDNFGGNVGISGEYAIVGANFEDDGGADAGAAYIFQKNEGGFDNWGEVSSHLASDAQSGDRFGYRVGISNGYAIVGAHFEDHDESGGNVLNNAGAVYIFKDNNSVLPVEMMSFEVTRAFKSILLNWQTLSEVNNKGFKIERSANGRVWQVIGYIAGHGTTFEKKDYQYVDESPYKGINYYRLQQEDFDGQVDYSEVRIVHYGEKGEAVTIYPNPFQDYLVIGNGKGVATITNLVGQPLKQFTITDEEFVQGTADLKHGSYLLTLERDNGERISFKILK